jgi:hypothetical protein
MIRASWGVVPSIEDTTISSMSSRTIRFLSRMSVAALFSPVAPCRGGQGESEGMRGQGEGEKSVASIS